MLLDLELLCEILVLFPLDLGADGAIIDKIATVTDLLLIEICFCESLILEELVGRECEDELESRLSTVLAIGRVIEILISDVDEMFQGTFIAIGYQFREADMIPQGGKPKLWNRSGGWGCVFRKGGIVFVVLEGILCTGLDFFSRGGLFAADNCIPAFIQGFGKFKIL